VKKVNKEPSLSEHKTVAESMHPTAIRSLRNGVPLLPTRPGAARVTAEQVRQLEEELR
jgi:hypothetical protein